MKKGMNLAAMAMALAPVAANAQNENVSSSSNASVSATHIDDGRVYLPFSHDVPAGTTYTEVRCTSYKQRFLSRQSEVFSSDNMNPSAEIAEKTAEKSITDMDSSSTVRDHMICVANTATTTEDSTGYFDVKAAMAAAKSSAHIANVKNETTAINKSESPTTIQFAPATSPHVAMTNSGAANNSITAMAYQPPRAKVTYSPMRVTRMPVSGKILAMLARQ
jgi:hypothetical protein